jgi:glycerol kinase
MWPALETISRLPRQSQLVSPEANDSAERRKTWSDAVARSTWNPAIVKGE